MANDRLLEPVHVAKISHHGSVNGTERVVVDTILPPDPADGRDRFAIVSTHDDDWKAFPTPTPSTSTAPGARSLTPGP